jgi:hypothetical protein
MLLPSELFVHLTMSPYTSKRELECRIGLAQKKHWALMTKWKAKYLLQLSPANMIPISNLWWAQQQIVIPPNEEIKKDILHSYHSGLITGLPGRDKTIRKVSSTYWWPGINQWITQYIKGCANCQQNKNLMHQKKTPLFHIHPNPNALPFKMVAMDLITQLPKSDGSNAILTIVDQGCTRAAVFLPCSTIIMGEGAAQLYLKNIYHWFRLLEKVISDRDPCFTSHFAKALCEKLQIQQNIFLAFHPQTDNLSKRTNQWIKQFLHLVAGAWQDNWKH